MLSKDLSLPLILYLDVLIAERHVTLAAERVGIGQPAMSTALNRLRVIFSDPLLVKTPNGMIPTDRALEITKHVRRAIDALEAATQARKGFEPSTAEGNIRIASSEGVALLLIPPLMRRIRSEAPGIRISAQPMDLRRLHQHLSEGVFHFAFGYAENVSNELYASLLYPQGSSVIASHDHREIQGSITLEQFVSFPHVIWGTEPTPYPTIEMMVDSALAERNLSRTVGIRVSNVLLTPAMVAGTDMIATVPERAAESACSQYQLQMIPLPFPMKDPDISMFWHERMHHDPLHSWLRKVIREIATDLKRKKALVHG